MICHLLFCGTTNSTWPNRSKRVGTFPIPCVSQCHLMGTKKLSSLWWQLPCETIYSLKFESPDPVGLLKGAEDLAISTNAELIH